MSQYNPESQEEANFYDGHPEEDEGPIIGEKELKRAARTWCQPTTSHLVMIPELAEEFAKVLTEYANAAEMLWVVLANVNGGDWTKQSQEWQEAAARWRDNYLQVVGLKEQPTNDK